MPRVSTPSQDDLHPRLIDFHRAIDFGPRGVPDARAWLHESWRVGGVTEMDQRPDGDWASSKGSRDAVSHLRQTELAAAEMYWVHPDMCRLVEHASPGVPGDTMLTPELLPAPTGVVFFAAAPTITTRYTQQAADVLSWTWADLGDAAGNPVGRGVNVLLYTSMALPPARFMVAESINWRAGLAVSEVESHSAKEQVARLLVSFAALIKSPGVAATHTERPDRATSRRCERKGLDLNDTRVVYLRYASQVSETSAERSYIHRWIVSGHWRMQPYGPERSARRPVWIAPYVKGPEGAPLLTGDKVNALVR